MDADHPVSSFEGWSDISRPDAAALRTAAGKYPLDVQLEYLQLPALDSRIPQLAASITATAKTDYDKAAAIERYLLTHFTYTLQLSRTPPSDPIAEFLFTRKQGHCEYFAAAMAVMLRALGIPSRVVNGFRGSEFNDLTSEYVVRDSDAHSWVEAYFPGYGWVSFDPTPGGPGQPHTAWDRAMLYVDAMESFWREWVDRVQRESTSRAGSNRDQFQPQFLLPYAAMDATWLCEPVGERTRHADWSDGVRDDDGF